jgi:hypothetical protein
MPPPMIKLVIMGCRTCTPALVAIRPVNEGKMAAPACASTKMSPN